MNKRFVIMKSSERELYAIYYSFLNSGCKKRTKRHSTYHSLVEAEKAAKRFQKNGYKLVEKISDL